MVIGVGLRFWAPTPMWLDEALSVNIARLPVTQIPRALAHDGAPPLYYLLLHAWMLVFGQSDLAVRALSGVVSVISLPFFWVAGHRLGGRAVAWITFFLALSSPFAINYATTARMYSLMILWTLLGFLALARALEDARPARLIALGAVTAAMLYTHYWAFYLLVATGGFLVWQWWRDRREGAPQLRANPAPASWSGFPGRRSSGSSCSTPGRPGLRPPAPATCSASSATSPEPGGGVGC